MKIGFIGSGKMACALARGMLASGKLQRYDQKNISLRTCSGKVNAADCIASSPAHDDQLLFTKGRVFVAKAPSTQYSYHLDYEF